MYPKNPLFQKCLTYLESLPNIKATIQEEPYLSTQVLADGSLIINTSDKIVNYVCEIKTNLTNDVIEQVAEYLTNLGKRLKSEQRPLLITRHLSNVVVERLLENNIEFVDVDGNIYLNSPELYVLVRNQVSKENTNKSLEINTAALQVMYVLLSQPISISRKNNSYANLFHNLGVSPKQVNNLSESVQKLSSVMNGENLSKPISKEDDFDEKIARFSDLSLKTVKITLKKLQELDYIKPKYGGYEIVDYVKLLERWELGYAERLRAKLLLGTFSPIGKWNFSEVTEELKEYADKSSYLIGGELAASIVTEYLRPISATLHLHKNVDARQIAVKLKLKPDIEGNIVLLQSFGNDEYQQNKFGELKNLVNPLLIHAELVQTGNSRLKETAQIIYARYIHEITQKND
ncbi:type IV toxin-antitoxin system AbiEi family antitoxin [Synechocystis sp. PCC 7509]|uniref:type IV toxin-antitoxin system AbiEi family antitoxin n=1 Tax=Synechocystis sp. PCC 7509 TaxID=927677 RepID=UPI0002AC8E02|nr:type IV toxin-antitoxin system AbiEi family antitoxin [Synechocystis sp. PCC 7509]